MPVEVPWNPRPGDGPDIQPNVEAVGFHPRLDPPAPRDEELLEVEELPAVEVGQRRPVVERRDEEVAVGVGEAVEDHEARGGPHDDAQFAVVFGRSRGRPAEEAAPVGAGPPDDWLSRCGPGGGIPLDVGQPPRGPKNVAVHSRHPTPPPHLPALTRGAFLRQMPGGDFGTAGFSAPPPLSPTPEAGVQFKVATDVFSGPMDLLLFLVKRQEVDITEVPIAVIASEFIASLEVLESLAIDQVGEFVELASVLLEIKARALVPRPEETEEPVELVREDLVQRLLEYKQYRDAAVLLEDRARRWDLRFARVGSDLPTGRGQAAEVSIGDVHVWDLVGAMARVLRKRENRRPRQIVHDDTPIETYMERIEGLVAGRGKVAFSELFEEAMPRSRLVGMFLAILELVRRHRLAARQEAIFDEIWLEPPPVVPEASSAQPLPATGSAPSECSTATSAPAPADAMSHRADPPPPADHPA